MPINARASFQFGCSLPSLLVFKFCSENINRSRRGSTMKRILLCSLAISTVFALTVSNADAAARKHHPYYGKALKTKAQHQRYVRLAADGDFIDRDGWRHGHSWDNSCFRTLDYLPYSSACSGAAGGGF